MASPDITRAKVVWNVLTKTWKICWLHGCKNKIQSNSLNWDTSGGDLFVPINQTVPINRRILHTILSFGTIIYVPIKQVSPLNGVPIKRILLYFTIESRSRFIQPLNNRACHSCIKTTSYEVLFRCKIKIKINLSNYLKKS